MERTVVEDQDLDMSPEDFLSRFSRQDLDAYITELDQRIEEAVREEKVGEEVKSVHELPILQIDESLAELELKTRQEIENLEDYILRQRVFIAANVGIPKLLADPPEKDPKLDEYAEKMNDLEFLEYFEGVCNLK